MNKYLDENLLGDNTNPPDTISKGPWIQVCYCLWKSLTIFYPDSPETVDTYGTIFGGSEEDVISKKYGKNTNDSGKLKKH